MAKSKKRAARRAAKAGVALAAAEAAPKRGRQARAGAPERLEQALGQGGEEGGSTCPGARQSPHFASPARGGGATPLLRACAAAVHARAAPRARQRLTRVVPCANPSGGVAPALADAALGALPPREADALLARMRARRERRMPAPRGSSYATVVRVHCRATAGGAAGREGFADALRVITAMEVRRRVVLARVLLRRASWKSG